MMAIRNLGFIRGALLALAMASGLGAQSTSAEPLVESYDLGRGPVSLYRPQTSEPDQPLPLVVALHGFTGSGLGNARYFGLIDQVEPRSFYLLTPDGSLNPDGDRFWNATRACCDFFNSEIDDVDYLEQLVEAVRADFAVDPSRIHFMGHSNGGFMSHRMACEKSEWVASIVSLAGAGYGATEECAPSQPVHVLQVHGTLDFTISYDGGCIFGSCYPGAEATVAQWAARNDCDDRVTVRDVAFNLDWAVAGDETTATAYETNCAADGSASLWTMTRSGHSPRFAAGGLAENHQFSQRTLDWLFAHPKAGSARLQVDGLWYDPATDGSGFNIVKTAFGYAIYYYGYEDNARFWLTSALYDGEFYRDEAVQLEVFAGPLGQGTLESPVKPEDLELWGTLILTFSDCAAGTAQLVGRDEGVVSAITLLAPSSGNACQQAR